MRPERRVLTNTFLDPNPQGVLASLFCSSTFLDPNPQGVLASLFRLALFALHFGWRTGKSFAP